MDFIHLPNDHFIGWWRFNEGQGDTCQDSSGNQHHLNLIGNPKWFSGRSGTAIHTGKACATGTIDPRFKTNDTFSLMAWVNTTNPETQEATDFTLDFMGRHCTLGYNTESTEIYLDCPGLHLSDRYPRVRVYTEVNIDDGRWHHIAGLYDGNSISIYVDGSINTRVDATGLIDPWDDSALTITTHGLIDEVRLYNRALSTPEIDAIVHEPFLSDPD